MRTRNGLLRAPRAAENATGAVLAATVAPLLALLIASTPAQASGSVSLVAHPYPFGTNSKSSKHGNQVAQQARTSIRAQGPMGSYPRNRGHPRRRRCGSVTITPMSGDVLFDIVTRGVRCRPAKRRLRAWGKNGYRPRGGPRGYRCREIQTFAAGNGRLRCHRNGRRLPVIAFTTGT